MDTDKVRCNISLEGLFSFSEVGFLETIINGMLKTHLTDNFEFFIYFKTTTSSFDIDENSLKNTVLFIVVDENDYVPDYLMGKPLLIFKHYLKKDRPEKNIYHLPVGPSNKISFDGVKPILERDLNVFFRKPSFRKSKFI